VLPVSPLPDRCVLWMQLDDARGVVKVLYHSQKEYERITGRLRMLREWKVCCGPFALPAAQHAVLFVAYLLSNQALSVERHSARP
jgi:hypothetical protein